MKIGAIYYMEKNCNINWAGSVFQEKPKLSWAVSSPLAKRSFLEKEAGVFIAELTNLFCSGRHQRLARASGRAS